MKRINFILITLLFFFPLEINFKCNIKNIPYISSDSAFAQNLQNQNSQQGLGGIGLGYGFGGNSLIVNMSPNALSGLSPYESAMLMTTAGIPINTLSNQGVMGPMAMVPSVIIPQQTMNTSNINLVNLFSGMYGSMYGGMIGGGGLLSGMYGMYGGLYGMYGGMEGLYGGLGFMGSLYGMSGVSVMNSYSTYFYNQSLLDPFISGIGYPQVPIDLYYGSLINPYYPLTTEYQKSQIGNAIRTAGTHGPVNFYIYFPPEGMVRAILTFNGDGYEGLVRDVQLGYMASNAYGFVHDANSGETLKNVRVEVEGVSRVKYTDPNGFYNFVFSNFSRAVLLYSKEGYIGIRKEILIGTSGLEYISPVYLELDPNDPNNINHYPRFVNFPDSAIEVEVGEEIVLDPNAYDPDLNDSVIIYFSGWKADEWTNFGKYVTTVEDRGKHWVTISAEDNHGGSVSETIWIRVIGRNWLDVGFGFNLISYPFANDDPNFTSFDILSMFGVPSLMDTIAIYSYTGNSILEAHVNSNGQCLGDDFPIKVGEGYILYTNSGFSSYISNRYVEEEQTLHLTTGINLVGFASFPDGYNCHDLMEDLGFDNVYSISSYDSFTGKWLSAFWSNGEPKGDLFPIEIGIGYKLIMKTDINFTISR